ncbi:SMI1/KNR4 family protein [Macrococcoides canis]|uniref:SMI1/KNR4 family protein n=1 Tax=Macrococcoides canis TaxID=1855823 RepID=UPI0020B6A16B|nr:SMI1/KNR4 family protein [Macrococcus canis]UTH01516.1 SMI1/KNR4 family protein [Macrococcus canis]
MNFEKIGNYIETDAKLRQSDIELFESWRGYKLPQDFVEFTLKYPSAYVEGSFDAEDRPGASINQFLKFEKSEFDSIYIDSLYEFSDFGPYVLFACDAGGNYLAFDYSKDKLNPSVVFIEHEELGIIEFPDGKSEHDFTEKELDRMMNSEKLEDFPWAVHYVSESFSSFIELTTFEELNNLYLSPNNFTTINEITLAEEYFGFKFDDEHINFLLRYSGYEFLKSKFEYNNILLKVKLIFSLCKDESMNLLYIYEKKGGKEKFGNLVPIMLVGQNNNIRDFSVVAYNYENISSPNIVIIPQDMFYYQEKIDKEKLIVVTDKTGEFFNKLTITLGNE